VTAGKSTRLGPIRTYPGASVVFNIKFTTIMSIPLSLPSRAFSMRSLLSIISLLAILLVAKPFVSAAEKKHSSLLQEDFPFQGACVTAKFPARNVAMKGLSIRVGPEANMVFDTELLRVSAGWTGGFITTHGVAFDGGHGAHPSIDGEQQFGTRQAPGWADANGTFADPRKEPFGPLPIEWCRYEGVHVIGTNVVLSYTVHGTKIDEQPSSIIVGDQVGFVRTFQTSKVKADLTTVIAEVDGGKAEVKGLTGTITAGNELTFVGLVGAPSGMRLDATERSILLKIPKGIKASLFKVVISRSAVGQEERFASMLEGKPAMVAFAKGGPAHWPDPVMTKGVLNTSKTPDGAYVTDCLTAPEKNPWNRRVRFGGMDFFSDGKRAALCTHDGDIWIVSGIDEKLDKLQWRRFASGQYETLGLVIVKDVIYTSGRDQITRYYDLNNDGEADYYENFNNQFMSTEGFHEFVFDLQTDKSGNFYFAKANPLKAGGGGFGGGGGNGEVCSHSGSLFKLSKDGKKLEIIARGFRAPNGIGVSAGGQVTTSDNEGTWVPSTPINWITPGTFCGVVNPLISKETANGWTPPLCWLSHSDYDNSGGGQVWVTSSKWGPYQDEMLHESYGKSSLFLVMKERLPDGRMQGGVVKFPLKFTSSCMRAHFNPADGQLYVAGLSEWQSNAGRITGFDRVRYTGKPVYSVRGLRVVKGGVELTFTQPLAADSAADLQNFSGKRWNYERAEHYGSPEFSSMNPKKTGREPIDITSSKLSEDGKTLMLAIADLQPVMQESIKFNLKAKDGTPIAQEIQHTIHAIH